MKKKSAGFSLVEMMVALFIFSLLAASGIALMRVAIDGRDAVASGNQDLRAMDLAVSLMRQDLSQITMRPLRTPYGGQRPFVFEGKRVGSEQPFLQFLRGGWPNPGGLEARGDVQSVSYILEGDTLMRVASLRPDPTPETPDIRRELLTGIQNIEVRYYGVGRWAEEWRAGGLTLAEIPKVIELTLAFQTGEVVRLLFLTPRGMQDAA